MAIHIANNGSSKSYTVYVSLTVAELSFPAKDAIELYVLDRSVLRSAWGPEAPWKTFGNILMGI